MFAQMTAGFSVGTSKNHQDTKAPRSIFARQRRAIFFLGVLVSWWFVPLATTQALKA
jgi:hypothetical protein